MIVKVKVNKSSKCWTQKRVTWVRNFKEVLPIAQQRNQQKKKHR